MSSFPPVSVFVINLKRSEGRRQHMASLCAKYHIAPLFVEAIEGNHLTGEDIARYADQDKARKCIYRELNRREIGCALSHRKIYQTMVDENIDWALVLEDDAEFDERLGVVLHYISHIKTSWEIILLGCHADLKREPFLSFWGRRRVMRNCVLGRPIEMAYGAYGYLINHQGAEKLLSKSHPLSKPIDWYTGSYGQGNLFVLSPRIIGLNETLNAASTIYQKQHTGQQMVNEGEGEVISQTLSKKIQYYIKYRLPGGFHLSRILTIPFYIGRLLYRADLFLNWRVKILFNQLLPPRLRK